MKESFENISLKEILFQCIIIDTELVETIYFPDIPKVKNILMKLNIIH